MPYYWRFVIFVLVVVTLALSWGEHANFISSTRVGAEAAVIDGPVGQLIAKRWVKRSSKLSGRHPDEVHLEMVGGTREL